MYSAQPPVSLQTMNGMRNNIMDGGTINPAALNSSGTAAIPSAPPTSAPAVAAVEISPRGKKRSRSPELYAEGQGDYAQDSEELQRQRKRGKPTKPGMAAANVPESPTLPSPRTSNPSQPTPVQTPQLPPQPLAPTTPVATPTQASPSKPAAKSAVKALPTVRDHTTDQLGPDEDEYIPRDIDPEGEKKIAVDGSLRGGRTYRCRTFFVPGRGSKLFMLATECARVLTYRDSYLLFNKNRSLYKIIATQPEKDNLIQQDILPYSYRSRQIAIVTAKSMFRQFGSRMVVAGRRVRDDYWETKAKKQGFTEDDLAGEKRPGASKMKEAAAEAASQNAALLDQHPSIVYSNGPLGQHDPSVPVGMGMPPGLSQYQMAHLAPHENRARDYGHITRPKQDISGPQYIDQSKPSSIAEIKTQAASAAEYNKNITQQSGHRATILNELWTRSPAPIATQQPPMEHATAMVQPRHSPRPGSSGALPGLPQPNISHSSHQLPHGLPQYSQPPHQQHVPAQQPPAARAMPQVAGPRPEQLQPRSSTVGLGQGPGPGGSYGYQPPAQMWPPSAPSQINQYNPPQQQTPQQQQQQQQQTQSPHPQHSPHQQLQHPQAPQQMHQNPMSYPAMGHVPQGYGAPGRNYYNPAANPAQQQQQPQQHYLHQTSAGQQPGMQGWAPPQSPHAQGQWNNQWPGSG